jgi:phage tail-like protein
MPSMTAQLQVSPGGQASGLSSGLPPYGLAMRFTVQVQGLASVAGATPGASFLGSWSACTGLKVKFNATKLKQGGDYTTEHILPEGISYDPVTLERAVHPTESAAVMTWLQKVAAYWTTPGAGVLPSGQTATIKLFDVTNSAVATWTLRNVYPAEWSGPTLNANDNKVAIEKLVLYHEGFLGP